MPFYTYACPECGHRTEVSRPVADRDQPPTHEENACPHKMIRLFCEGFNFALKGGGWFADGYSKDKKK
jgi:putative FmdB family regulatory protein